MYKRKSNSKEKYGTSGLFFKIFGLMMKWPVIQNIRILFYLIDSFILFFLKKPQKVSEKKKRVLIVFPFSLGDCIMFCGTAKYYRQLFSEEQYELSVACRREYAELLSPYFDRVLALDYIKATVNLVERIRLLQAIRQRYYEEVFDPVTCAICSPNIFTVNAAVAGKKTGIYEGIGKRRDQCPDWLRNRIYTEIVHMREQGLHRVKYYGEVLKLFGLKNCTVSLAKFPTVPLKLSLPGRYYIVYPSASIRAKMWPVERYAYIVKKIYESCKLPAVLCGTQHDREVNEELKRQVPGVPVIDVISRTSARELVELVGRAIFVLTNDTGLYHIAMAQNVPTFIVGGGYVYDTFLNYHYEQEGYRQPYLICKERECFNCFEYCRFFEGVTYPCLADVTEEYAWGKIYPALREICGE